MNAAPQITVVERWTELERAAAAQQLPTPAPNAAEIQRVVDRLEAILDAVEGIEGITYRCVVREEAAFVGVSVHDLALINRLDLAALLTTAIELGVGVFRLEIYDDYRNGVMGPESEGHIAELLLLPGRWIVWFKREILQNEIMESLASCQGSGRVGLDPTRQSR